MVKKTCYTAVIRTLGTAGSKYQQLLDSLDRQTIRPDKIIVYLAEGYGVPKETVGWEQYVYVKKGMVAQRALNYDEVDTEYILFLDDDLSFPEDTVERMFDLLWANEADVISPDIFPNASRSWVSELMMTVSGRMYSRRNDSYWGYKVMRTAGYSYNSSPVKETYWSQTNAGACFLCSKRNFQKIHFEDEMWLDQMRYALGDDQVMYYKMYLYGLKTLTWFKHKFVHLDGGENLKPEKKRGLIYADFRFKTIFWHRFIYLPDDQWTSRLWSTFCFVYALSFTLVISLLKCELGIFRLKFNAIRDAVTYIKSNDYRNLPLVK